MRYRVPAPDDLERKMVGHRGRSGLLLTLAALIGASMALTGGAWLLLRPVPVLQVVTRPEGRVIWASAVRPGYRFSLAYRHSIYNVLVEERFEVDAAGDLRLRGIGAGSEAAIQYYDLPGRIEREGRNFVINGLDRAMPEISLLVDSVGRREILIEGDAVPLYRLVPDGQAISLRVVRWSWAKAQLSVKPKP